MAVIHLYDVFYDDVVEVVAAYDVVPEQHDELVEVVAAHVYHH